MTKLRIGALNIPLDADKLPNGPARAKEAAKQINSSNLDFISLNELDRSPGSTSHNYAQQLLKALGSGWASVNPTTAWNENYIFYRTKQVKLAKQDKDLILASKAGGRHATRATFEKNGEQVHVKSTHFVSGKNNGSAREQQGTALAKDVNARTIVLGDLNQKAVPKALAAALKTARDSAEATTNAQYGTYAKWSAKKPSTAASAFLDHILVPKAWQVNGYTVVGISGDAFTQPRASDHFLIITSVTIPATLDKGIKFYQEQLTELGFFLGKPDGVEGSKTRGAVKRFQQAWNLGTKLTPDSVMGPKTLAALVITIQKGGRLSEHFTAREVQCKCRGKYANCLGVLVYREDLQGLEQLRKAAYPRGLAIVSAYRCDKHNKAVGGASVSQHRQGKAFDIPAVLKHNSTKIPARFKGIGYNRSNQKVRHIDSRATRAKWIY